MAAEKFRHLADATPPVDALFVQAALGRVRGFTPDRSTAKWVASLAQQPRVVGRRLGQLGGENVDTTDRWLGGAETPQGSWWTDLADWLNVRCGELKPAPERLGSAAFPLLADAPGTYVLEKWN
jgi:hypothetical protein